MTRHEFFVSDFEKSILPGIQSGEYKPWEVERAIDELYKKDIYALRVHQISLLDIRLRNNEVMKRFRGKRLLLMF